MVLLGSSNCSKTWMFWYYELFHESNRATAPRSTMAGQRQFGRSFIYCAVMVFYIYTPLNYGGNASNFMGNIAVIALYETHYYLHLSINISCKRLKSSGKMELKEIDFSAARNSTLCGDALRSGEYFKWFLEHNPRGLARAWSHYSRAARGRSPRCSRSLTTGSPAHRRSVRGNLATCRRENASELFFANWNILLRRHIGFITDRVPPATGCY